jgi:hypothetical protein
VSTHRARVLWPIVGWCIAVAATSLSLWPTLRQAIVGDDLVFVTFGGLGRLWANPSIPDFTRYWIVENVGSNHVTPLNGVAYALQIIGVDRLQGLGIGIADAWTFFRLAWIEVAILASAFLLHSWQPLMRLPAVPRRHAMLLYFSLISATVVATVQLHALWTYDPVLSYSVATWLTISLGLVYLATLARLWSAERSALGRWAAAAIACGIVGVLTYEMMIAAVLAGAIAVAILAFSRWRAEGLVRRLVWSATALAIPFVTFAAAQWARSLWPSWYEGTQTGYTALILPVLIAGVIGSLPLASMQLAQSAAGGISADVGAVLQTWFAVIVLGSLSFRILRRGAQPNAPKKGANWWAVSALVLALGAFWVGSTLIFAVSAKYQYELGTTIGNTYLHYSVGILCVACLVTLAALALAPLTRAYSVVGLVVILMAVSAIQASANSSIARALDAKLGWTIPLVDALDGTVDDAARCRLGADLTGSGLPERQRIAIMNGLSDAYLARYGKEYCQEWVNRPAPADNLALH